MEHKYTFESLPPHVQWYRTVGTWRGDTIPKGLFKKHNTGKGVWGTIAVIQGAIVYYDYATDSTALLTASETGVIPTQKYHHIQIPDHLTPKQVHIQVDFYR